MMPSGKISRRFSICFAVRTEEVLPNPQLNLSVTPCAGRKRRDRRLTEHYTDMKNNGSAKRIRALALACGAVLCMQMACAIVHESRDNWLEPFLKLVGRSPNDFEQLLLPGALELRPASAYEMAGQARLILPGFSAQDAHVSVSVGKNTIDAVDLKFPQLHANTLHGALSDYWGEGDVTLACGAGPSITVVWWRRGEHDVALYKLTPPSLWIVDL